MWDLNAIKQLQRRCSYCGSGKFVHLAALPEESFVKCFDCGKQRYQE